MNKVLNHATATNNNKLSFKYFFGNLLGCYNNDTTKEPETKTRSGSE